MPSALPLPAFVRVSCSSVLLRYLRSAVSARQDTCWGPGGRGFLGLPLLRWLDRPPDSVGWAQLTAFLRRGEAPDISSTNKAKRVQRQHQQKKKTISVGLLLHYGICWMRDVSAVHWKAISNRRLDVELGIWVWNIRSILDLNSPLLQEISIPYKRKAADLAPDFTVFYRLRKNPGKAALPAQHYRHAALPAQRPACAQSLTQTRQRSLTKRGRGVVGVCTYNDLSKHKRESRH